MGNLSHRASAKCRESRVKSHCMRKETWARFGGAIGSSRCLGFRPFHADRPSESFEGLRRIGRFHWRSWVADDDPVMRALLEMDCRSKGHMVSFAADSHEALALAGSGKAAQLLILDIAVPGLSGGGHPGGCGCGRTRRRSPSFEA
jgi:hypothetical protein